MLAEKVEESKEEVAVCGYIRGNFLNASRVIHVTGRTEGLKIKRIEAAEDPCPLKISAEHKQKMMDSMKGSKVTSRRASMHGDSSMGDTSKVL